MANFFPLYIDTGSIRPLSGSLITNYMNFPVTFSVSASYSTRLPDPYYIQTSSINITNANNATSSSVFVFSVPNAREQYYYLTDTIFGVQSAAGATGVRIALQPQNNGDAITAVKAGSNSLTAFTYQYKGSQDVFAFALPATTLVANTTYPSQVKGILTNSTASNTTTFRNVLLLQSETNQIVTAVSGTVNYNVYAGYSSSAVPVSSSQTPLVLSNGSLTNLQVGDLLTQSVLPPTASLWQSQSLTANVFTGSNTVYQTVFTLTGLTTNQRYLVNFYLIGSSPLTTTGLQVRAVTGSFYRGSIYSPSAATNTSIANSADGDNISNANTGWPVNNAKAVVWGEYTFIKGANDPQIQIRSEISASTVTVFSGSVVFYRALN